MALLDKKVIQEKISSLQGWEIMDNALEKQYKFKDFKKAISFMVEVSFICEAKNHHPDWTNVYNKLTIRLSTHDAGGITEKDLDLATAIDKLSS